jgi:hypothetical protein
MTDVDQELRNQLAAIASHARVADLSATAIAKARSLRRTRAISAATACAVLVAGIAVGGWAISRTPPGPAQLPAGSSAPTTVATGPTPAPTANTSTSPTVGASSAAVTAPPSSTVRGGPTTAPARSPTPGGNPLVDEVWGDNSVPFRPPTGADYAHATLVRRAIGQSGVSILVPAGWAFADETIPSDHDDLVFYDPANPAARIEYTATGCVGCIEIDVNAPTPRASAAVGVPGDAVRYDVYNGGLTAGFEETHADGYAVNGVVQVFGTVSSPAGYAVYRVSLPPADTALATKILDSYR